LICTCLLSALRATTFHALTTMPGCSFIFGFLPFTNCRVLSRERPRTYTYDAEVVIGEDKTGEVQTITALLQYFVPSDAIVPSEGRIHYVWDHPERTADYLSEISHNGVPPHTLRLK
jgi:hypothetical protein